jgi:hypothetical protein
MRSSIANRRQRALNSLQLHGTSWTSTTKEVNEGGQLELVRDDSRLCLNGQGNYKDGGDFTDRRISLRRLKAARDKMRSKKESVLYKNFELPFLKS